jgi:FtsH-binding integral membrane protein
MPRAQKLLFVASVLMFAISVAHLALVFQYNTSKRTVKNGQARVILSVFQVRPANILSTMCYVLNYHPLSFLLVTLL